MIFNPLLSMSYNVPVLFIIFKRYDTTVKVFERIREAKPKKLYVAADGPRNAGEKEMCDKTRSVISLVDWDCEVLTLFRDDNIGCKYMPYESISWFLEHEAEGVILEDDCVPDPSFFPFMEQMLERYRDDSRIGMIAGHSDVSIPLPTSYVFSRFKACWGWATWRRAWQFMDLELENYDYRKEVAPLMVYEPGRVAHWLTALDLIDQHKVNAWDWPWYFSQAAQNLLCVFPSRSLVSNIGFGEDGTHCLGEAPPEALASFPMEFPLVHPRTVIVNYEFEKEWEKGLCMGQQPASRKRSLPSRIAKVFREAGRKIRRGLGTR